MIQFDFIRGTQKEQYLVHSKLKTKEYIMAQQINGVKRTVIRGTDIYEIKKSLIN